MHPTLSPEAAALLAPLAREAAAKLQNLATLQRLGGHWAEAEAVTRQAAALTEAAQALVAPAPVPSTTLGQRHPERGWVLTPSSWRKVWPLALQPQDISLADIAHSLSHQARFLGYTSEAYSVAQHSCLISDELMGAFGDRELARWGLLHDASEAYLGDIISPIKYSGAFEVYREAEQAAMAVICTVFGLPLEEPQQVKLFDKRALATERRDLVPAWASYSGPTEAREAVEPFPQTLVVWPAKRARIEFLERWYRLGDAS